MLKNKVTVLVTVLRLFVTISSPSKKTDTNGSFGFCVRKFFRFSWLRRLKLRTQRAVISFVSVNELVFLCKDA